jgi:hypothetical protein
MTEETKVDVSEALVNNYMLTDLVVRIWSGRKTDKEASRELTSNKKAVSNAASVVKNLFAGQDAELKDTHAAYTRIRTWFYSKTVPWSTASVGAMKGSRLIATIDSIDFMSEFAKMKKEAEDVRDTLVNKYDNLLQKVQVSQGDLYNPAHYPSKQQVALLFGAELSVQPLPATTDFNRLTNLPSKLVSGLQDLYDRSLETQMENALTDVQRRLVDELERMDTQLSKVARGEKTRLFKSMVGNLKHLVSLTRNMNFTGNAEIEAIADGIEEHLCAYEVDMYKDNAALAGDTAEAARKIRKWVGEDRVWAVEPHENENREPLHSEVVDEVTDGTPEVIDEDQEFLRSLTEPPAESASVDNTETPDFDEDEFLFSS